MGDLPLVVLATSRETFFQTPLVLKYAVRLHLVRDSFEDCPAKPPWVDLGVGRNRT